jgi:hypothetical protein
MTLYVSPYVIFKNATALCEWANLYEAKKNEVLKTNIAL